MSPIRFHLELEPGTDLDAVADRLQARLSDLDLVERAEAARDDQRSTAEIAAIVAAVVVIARESGDFVVHLRRFVQELQGLVEDIQGLRRVVFDVDGQTTSLDAMGPDELSALADGI